MFYFAKSRIAIAGGIYRKFGLFFFYCLFAGHYLVIQVRAMIGRGYTCSICSSF
ncbi:hypothetical protein OIU78_015334 [Salix suchowensis]|nr:hypothetical protein OIU78_015334 [Salix suchowensis]